MTRTRLGGIPVLTVLLVIAVGGAAPAGAVLPPASPRAFAGAGHCGRHAVPLKLHRRHTQTCLLLEHATKAHASSPDPLFAHQLSRLRVGPRHHRSAHRVPKVLRSPAIQRANRRAQTASDHLRMPALPTLRTRPPTRTGMAAKITPIHESANFSQNGFEGRATLDGSEFEPDQGTTGSLGFDKTVDAHAHKGEAVLHHHDRERLAANACPSVSGEVPGTYVWSRSDDWTVPYRGGTGEIDQYVGIDTQITGHTTDRGKLRDFDLAMTYHTMTRGIIRDKDGKIVESDPPNLWTVHLTRKGLHLGDPFDQVLDGDGKDVQVGRVVGPDGAWDAKIPRDDLAVARDAVLKLALSALRAGQLLASLQSNWQDGSCVALDFTSSDVSLSPHLDLDGHPNGGQMTTMTAGQVAHLTSHLTAVRVKKLAAGTFTTTLSRSGAGSPGTLSPTSGTYTPTTHAFTFTAPTDGWTDPTETIEVAVDFYSHQGHALGWLLVSPQARRWRLVYTHSSDGDPTFTYQHYSTFDADGTVIVHHHLQLSGSATLELNPSQSSGTGSGAVTWQQHTWSVDDDDTENSGQDPGVRCEIDYDHSITAVQPGTLTVKSISLGPAGADGVPTISSLDVLLAGVSETWQWIETQKAGPCPGINSTGTEHDFINQLTSSYYNGAPGVTEGPPSDTAVELRFDGTGWQASQGGLTKTLTSSYQPDFYNDPPQGAAVPWTDTFRLEPVPSP